MHTRARWAIVAIALAAARAEAQGANGGQLAESQLDAVVDQYRAARRIFGDSHLLLTAVFYGGQDRERGTGNKVVRTGAAGLISVPLGGFGGGHGAEWWPRLETDDEAATIMDFDRRISSYHDVLKRGAEGATPEAVEQAAGTRFERRARQFDALLEADSLQAASVRGDPGSAECAPGWVIGRPERLRACLQTLRGSTATAKVKLEQLDALWDEYLRLKGQHPKVRHNVLIGPTVGLPLNDSAVAMWGILVETGGSVRGTPLRVVLSGGLLRPRNNPFSFATPPDWWLGIGLSGQFGDDLFNGLRGAYTAGTGRP